MVKDDFVYLTDKDQIKIKAGFLGYNLVVYSGER